MYRSPRSAASIPARAAPAKFEYVADAGTFVCEGRFSFGAGSGSYTFQPNPRYIAELQSLGYDAPREDQLFTHGRCCRSR